MWELSYWNVGGIAIGLGIYLIGLMGRIFWAWIRGKESPTERRFALCIFAMIGGFLLSGFTPYLIDFYQTYISCNVGGYKCL